MGVRFPSAFSTVALSSFISFPSEQLAVTSPPISQAIDGQVFLILWMMGFTSGVTGPLIQYIIRRGATLTGAIVYISPSIQEAGSASFVRSGMFIDSPGIVANVQYSLTYNVTNGASNGSLGQVALAVLAL